MPGDKPRPKAESKAQQAAMGIAHAIQKGEMAPQKGTPSAEIAKSMDPADVKSAAKTTHEGLPEHKKKRRMRRVHVDDKIKTKSF